METQKLALSSCSHKQSWGRMLSSAARCPAGPAGVELSPFKLNKCCYNEARSSLLVDKKLSIDLMSFLQKPPLLHSLED